MKKYITHVVVPQCITGILKSSVGIPKVKGISPARYNLSISGIHGFDIHADISAESGLFDIKSKIKVYNNEGNDLFTSKCGYFIGSHELNAISPGSSDTYRLIIEEQSISLVESLSEENKAEEFMLRGLSDLLPDNECVILTYYTFVPDKFDVLVSMSNYHFSYRKIK